jgi:hypothetical protein
LESTFLQKFSQTFFMFDITYVWLEVATVQYSTVNLLLKVQYIWKYGYTTLYLKSQDVYIFNHDIWLIVLSIFSWADKSMKSFQQIDTR